MTVVYDWPSSIQPSGQNFRVFGQAIEGGLTVRESLVMSPEPGGRGTLDLTFNAQKQPGSSRLFSWLESKITNRNVFRYPLKVTGQLVSASELGVDLPGLYETLGIPWDGGVYWDNGMGWAYEPSIVTNLLSLEAETAIRVNMGTYAPGLGHGHLIGINDVTHIIDDIGYDGQIASIAISPPLRQDLDIGSIVSLRPKMLATCQEPDAFKAIFDVSGIIWPGSITLSEAIL